MCPVSTVQARSKRRRSSGGKIALGVLLGALALLVAVYLADLVMNRGNVPRGTEVGGVAIGGMSPKDAQDKLAFELGDVADKQVEVTAGSEHAAFVPAAAGLGIDWQGTVEAAGVQSANPLTRLQRLVTTREVDVVPSVDEAKLNPELDRLAGELHRDPVDATITVDGGKAKTTDAEPGQEVARDVLREGVTTQWLHADGVSVEPGEIAPAVGKNQIDQAMHGPVRAALDGPLTLRGENQVAASIPQERLGEVIQFPVVDGAIAPRVDREAAQAILAEQLAPTEREMVNARVRNDGSVDESADGSVVDWDKTMDGFDERALGNTARDWDAAYKPVPATFTTEMARNATFDEVVGTFTTGGYSGASGTNIALVAQTVNGAVVNPGETFSLNGYTGPRGTAQGYVESGIILNGHADNAVGGGISQFATTLYNAAYFAGMTDVAHTPHSYYISRYPAGREATVYEGAIDLQFRNDSTHPVKITTSVGGGQVTVNLMGVKTVNVESANGGRWAETQPSPQTVSGAGCVPSSGAPGFTTSDTRTIRDLAGNVLSQETQTTVYDPQPSVSCG